MKEQSTGFIQSFRNKAKGFATPLALGMALSIAPITIDGDMNLETKMSIAYSEKETDVMMYKKLSSEYARMYNPNYAISPNEAIQKNDMNETIATNGVSITHKYRGDTGKWEKLDENQPWATPEVRIKNSLNSILKMNYFINNPDGTQSKIPNPLNINEQDIRQYLDEKTDVGLKSFQVINNAENKPALVVVTGPLSGLNEENKSIIGIKKGFDFLNKVDPSIVDKITHQYFVRAIGGEIINTNLRKNDFDSTSRPTINTVCINGGRVGDNYILDALSILMQSRYIYTWKNVTSIEGSTKSIVKDRLDEDNNLDKFYWVKKWISDNRTKMSGKEFDEISKYLDKSISGYKEQNK